jgi:uroporphyrinogen decarboxylase
LNSEERVINALLRKEIDKVPTFEWSIDKKVIEGICPRDTINVFINRMEIDGLTVDINYREEEIGPGIFKNEWGNIIEYSGEHLGMSKGCIRTIKDLNRYEPPNPTDSYRFKTLSRAQKIHKGKKAIILHLNDVISIARDLLGFQNLMENILLNPLLVRDIVELAVQFNIKLAKEAANRNVKIIYIGGDYASASGLLMSKKDFNNIFYPGFCKTVKAYKELGLIVIKHSDGDIREIMDELINSGIDCIDPIDPTAGMTIKEIKRKYGNRIAIKGNVDCSKLLTFGTEEQVIEETKKCLKNGAPNSGYILSSSNSIHSGVKPSNYIAMLSALKKYGNYPLVF